MRKFCFALAGLLFFCLGLAAQTNDAPVVVVATSGKGTYVSADKSVKLQIAPGVVLKRSGTLKLTGNATAVVYADGRLQQVKGSGAHPFAVVFPEGGQSPLNFDPKFGTYVQSAVQLTALKSGSDGWGTGVSDPIRSGDGWGTGVSDPIRSGDGWGTGVSDPIRSGDGWGTGVSDPIRSGDGWGTGVSDPIRSGDGWGGRGSKIVPIMPLGQLTPGVVVFSWSKPAGASAYRVDIQDENNKVLHSVTVQDTFARIDLKALQLETGNHYFWRVQVPDVAELMSGPLEFYLATPEEQAKAAKKAVNSRVYPVGGPVLQGMMEATALQYDDWHYAAQQKYAALLQQYPGNKMVRMMYAAFWMRWGLEAKAKEVLR